MTLNDLFNDTACRGHSATAELLVGLVSLGIFASRRSTRGGVALRRPMRCVEPCLSVSAISRLACKLTLVKTAEHRTISNTVIGTLAVDGWAVTFCTARRGLGGLGSRPVPSSLYKM